jgi:hypothetical protein
MKTLAASPRRAARRLGGAGNVHVARARRPLAIAPVRVLPGMRKARRENGKGNEGRDKGLIGVVLSKG